MRSRRWSIGGAAIAIALVAAAVASGAGPWPGLAAGVTASDGSVRYTARTAGSSTRVAATRVRDGHVLRVARVTGGFGVPAVTISGVSGGLSVDGRTLVLAQSPSYDAPSSESRFVVLSTATLRPVRTIVLRGDFAFDALSPDARTLYLIQHRSTSDASYAVRAFDLRAGKLLPKAIVDKSEADQAMRGFPVARATSADGTWVYTLYRRVNQKPFVHALNTRGRYAVCVDLPRQVADEWIWSAALDLTDGGARLVVRLATDATAFTIDTRTLRVVST